MVSSRVVKSGLLPTGRSKQWASETLNLGDRTQHEHFILTKVLELACEVDQVNVPTLASLEVVCRRLQLIEYSYSQNPSNPEYSLSEFPMGFHNGRSQAMVSPGSTKYAAEKAKER